ncbi:Dipeptidyl aminopeptidase/acylaminoacyl peptidase [Halogranum rubrum]|uniref:Dipeptidyl aminopeptidase/acylaminoacyl peptidase n=1 Tax=Halogranum rubrum TaxID=553466 RepID=A0A1I4HUI8_9EURY|nr:prolyl oligopeptidase family serine peptidase [Halogranum rubrum]SFL45812.1 Dipeptidyl aminopeptidase/acylaminoacyl peptidase [Halogranum rubrum]
MTEDYPLAELASLPSFYHPAASPSGDEIAVYYDGSGRNELYLIDPETGAKTQLSEGNVPRDARYPFRWAPSGDELYFHQDRDGNEQNDIMAIGRDGAVEAVVENEGQTILSDVSEDGRYVLLVSDVGQQMNLYEHDRELDTTTRLTEYRQPVRGGVYGPEADQVAYTTNESEDLDNQDVYVAEISRHDDGEEHVELTDVRNLEIGEAGAEAGVSDVGPEGDRLLVSDNSSDKPRVGVYDLTTDAVTWLTNPDHVESPTTFLPSGEGVLATRTRKCAVVPVVHELTGKSYELDLPEGVASFPGYGDAALLSDTEVLVTQQTPTDRSTLLRVDLESGASHTVLEPEYGSLDPDGFVDCSYETFESHDGLEIEALVYDSGRRPSPVVVKVHGGPAGQDLKQFDLYTQLLATRGYSVLQVNYRGSSGRGRKFKNMINGDWGGAEQGDIAAGTRWLAEKEWVDADRIAVMGGSYGGYSTNMQLVTYPELYAAGISQVGITDLKALYEESMPHFKTALERYLGDPEANAALYEERSAVTHVDKLAATLCIIHGVNDPRCPISQARLFRDALLDAGYEEGDGGDFEYNELGEEGHGSTDIDNKIRSFELVADFLERRMPVEESADTSD